jgi:hypothetical protein
MRDLVFKISAIICIIISAVSCSESGNSILYNWDPESMPTIPDTVKAREKILQGRLYSFSEKYTKKMKWYHKSAKLYAVLLNTDASNNINPHNNHIISEADIDNLGFYSLILPSSLPGGFTVYAKEADTLLRTNSKYLLTNKNKLLLIVEYENPATISYQKLLYKEVLFYNEFETKQLSSEIFEYKFFNDTATLQGIKIENNGLDSIQYLTECKIGWNLIQNKENKIEIIEQIPAGTFQIIKDL